MKKRRKRKRGSNPTGKSAPPYPFEFKLRLVRLYLEDGYGVPMLAQEFEISEYSLYRWGQTVPRARGSRAAAQGAIQTGFASVGKRSRENS